MIVWSEIKNICNRINFPESAVSYFEQCYNKILPKYADDLQMLTVEWMSVDIDWRKCLKIISTIASDAGVSFYTMQMFFFLYCAIPLRQKYQEKCLAESLYWETLQDLRYKILQPPFDLCICN